MGYVYRIRKKPKKFIKLQRIYVVRYVHTGAKFRSCHTKESQLISVPNQWNRLIGFVTDRLRPSARLCRLTSCLKMPKTRNFKSMPVKIWLPWKQYPWTMEHQTHSILKKSIDMTVWSQFRNFPPRLPCKSGNGGHDLTFINVYQYIGLVLLCSFWLCHLLVQFFKTWNQQNGFIAEQVSTEWVNCSKWGCFLWSSNLPLTNERAWL